MTRESQPEGVFARKPGAESTRRGYALIATGAVGVAFAAICCATPILAITLGTIGLAAWMASADGVLLAVFVASVALISVGFYRRGVRNTHDK